MPDKYYCDDVAAVVVTYNPDKQTLIATLNSTIDQVSHLCIVDNASESSSRAELEAITSTYGQKVQLLHQAHNTGLGSAHNTGIRNCIAQHADFILLLDQDSQPAPDMVLKLRKACNTLTRENRKVATVGPRYSSPDSDTLSKFVKMKFLRFGRLDCKENDSLLKADFIVSSGSIIPAKAYQAIGPLDESLFIDHVDTEWCFRAKSKGHEVIGVCDATMKHALGERQKTIWFLRKRTVHFHKPFRYYYIFRNSILLYRRKHMPMKWKSTDFIRCVATLFFFCIAGEQRLVTLKMIFSGVKDGCSNVSGPRKF